MAQDETSSGGPAGFDVDRVIDATMALAADKGWDQVSLLDIARAAQVSLAELYRRFPGKTEILAEFARRVDERVLAGMPMEDLEESARDRLFEVLMLRFDELQPYREAIRSILDSYQRDPLAVCGGLRQLRRSMTAMLEAADLAASGLRGELRLDGLCAIYAWTLRTWLDDDSADMAKTMAALDGSLRRVERPIAVVEGVRRPRMPGRPEERPGDAA